VQHLVRRDTQLEIHAVTPKIAPTPAVNAIAKAPQKVTLKVALRTGAPPVLADNEPSDAKNSSELAGTAHIIA
jgi:hypothetical protein